MEKETRELTYYLTTEQYAEAEKMAKKNGYDSVADFALYCMQKYIKEKEE